MAARRRRRRAPPQEPFVVEIDELAHDGRGVAKRDGKVVFVHGALAGERVVCRYTACHSQYDEAAVERVLAPSPQRVEPLCRHVDRCGGCALQHLQPDAQLAAKQTWLQQNLARIAGLNPEQWLPALSGPVYAYRYKARLGVKYVAAKGRVLVGFRERDAPFVADLQRCEVLHPDVAGLLPELAALVGSLGICRRVPQIELAFGDDGGALVFRVLDPPGQSDCDALIGFGERHGLAVYIQPRGPATVTPLGPPPPPLRYRLPRFDLSLDFMPQHFTQVNPALNRQMVERALQLLAPQPDERVLDLYCGLGNFTLALARHSAAVVGVDGEPALIDRAARNAAANGLDNVEFFTADLNRPPAGAAWQQPGYDKVLLDPPRSGAAACLPLLAELAPARIVYVSCHPATLARDAAQLCGDYGYRLRRAGVMDMFPHTAHVESIALFERDGAGAGGGTARNHRPGPDIIRSDGMSD